MKKCFGGHGTEQYREVVSEMCINENLMNHLKGFTGCIEEILLRCNDTSAQSLVEAINRLFIGWTLPQAELIKILEAIQVHTETRIAQLQNENDQKVLEGIINVSTGATKD